MQSHITIDHRKIKRGGEERGGHPASVKSTGGKGDAGILRINLRSYGADDELDDISWDEFFAQVEKKQLAFMYQDAIKPDTSAASIKWSGAIRKRHLVRSRIRSASLTKSSISTAAPLVRAAHSAWARKRLAANGVIPLHTTGVTA